MKRCIKISIALIAMLLLGPAPAWAQRNSWWGSSNQHDSRDVRSAFRTVVADASQSTVRVVCDGKDTALGTVVGADGWIVTKYSELREPVAVRLPDKRQLPAQVVGQDPHYDLAMLKVNATDLKPADWSDDEKGPAVGQLLATVAGTGDLPRAIGVVSVPRRVIPPDARLGVRFDDSPNEAKIGQIISGGAADQAGLKVGDIVLRLDDIPIDNRDTMIETVHQYRPGDKIAIVVRRGDDEVKISATLTSSLAAGSLSRSDRMNEMGTHLSKRSADFPPVIQHDTAIEPADCGGPLVDLDGKVVGINIARGGRTESYAVPADRVRSLLFDMEHSKLLPKNALPGIVASKPEDAANKVVQAVTKANETANKAEDKKPDENKSSEK